MHPQMNVPKPQKRLLSLQSDQKLATKSVRFKDPR